MSISLVVGTPKGAAVLRSDDRRYWREDFVLRGWPVTASVRDDQGRVYVAVNSPNYGVALFVSDDLETWTQLETAPRYRSTDRGNPEHHRLIAKEDFGGLLKSGGRFVDQIWNLHFAHGALYAGVSEARATSSAATAAPHGNPSTVSTSIPAATPGCPASAALARTPSSPTPTTRMRMWVGVLRPPAFFLHR